jgi:hypothetical protein
MKGEGSALSDTRMSLGVVSLVAWPPSSTYSRGGQKSGTALVPLATSPRRFSTNPVGAHPNPQVDTETKSTTT